MTTHERAKAAAEFLNSGKKWKIMATPALTSGDARYGIWQCAYKGEIPSYKRNSGVIRLARREGWQENQPQNVPQIPPENGTQGDWEVGTLSFPISSGTVDLAFIDQVTKVPGIPFRRDFEDDDQP